MKLALSFPAVHKRGGAERVLVEAANHLVGQGHDVHVLTSQLEEGCLTSEVKVHLIASSTYIPAMKRRRFCVDSQTTLSRIAPPVHVHGLFGVMGPANGVVWVQSVHAAWIDISRRTRPLALRLRQRLNPFHYYALHRERHYYGGRRYRRLIALSTQVRDDLQRFYSVPPADIVVLPNGFSHTEFNIDRRHSERPSMRAQLGFVESDRVVVFVANELERKGFLPLLRAMGSLQDERLKLLIVGRVDIRSYSREIAQARMSKSITAVGSKNDVARYYAAADLFALPTKYEAWGLVIIEAMATGLPVLTSRLAGAAIAVQEGRTGELLDDPADEAEIRQKIQLLLSNNYDTPSAVSESVQHLRWSQILSRYARILQECSD